MYFMFMYLHLITNIKDHYNLYNQINLEKKSSDPRPAWAINNDRYPVSLGRILLTFSATSETEAVANCKKNFSRPWRVVQYSQIDSIGVSGDKKGLHWYQWYDWYQ